MPPATSQARTDKVDSATGQRLVIMGDPSSGNYRVLGPLVLHVIITDPAPGRQADVSVDGIANRSN